MEVMIHFVFEIIKIAILSTLYSGVILILLSVFAKLNPEVSVTNLLVNKRKLFVKSVTIISVALFIYMFTYWGDHGLGDSSTLPIGHYKAVNRVNSEYSYIEDQHGKQLYIHNFVYNDDYLYAALSKDFENYKKDIVIWDLETCKWKLFQDQDYIAIANQKNYPMPGSFKDFDDQYKRHWNGWRFWVLP